MKLFLKPFANLFTAMAFFMLLPASSFSQVKTDSLPPTKILKDTIPVSQHPPKKATIMSACLPGLGQAYNHKYWKIPIIYAGLGTFGYFTYYTNGRYNDFKNEYIFRIHNAGQVNSFEEYDTDQLKENVDFYRRYRDLSVILIAAVYTLNIVDANVDAHLFTFDVSDDLSMRVLPQPVYSLASGKTGLQLGVLLRFR